MEHGVRFGVWDRTQACFITSGPEECTVHEFLTRCRSHLWHKFVIFIWSTVADRLTCPAPDRVLMFTEHFTFRSCVFSVYIIKIYVIAYQKKLMFPVLLRKLIFIIFLKTCTNEYLLCIKGQIPFYVKNVLLIETRLFCSIL